MSTLRVDEYVTVKCDNCGALGELVELRAGWRWDFDGWLFYATCDVQLCPSCTVRMQEVKNR